MTVEAASQSEPVGIKRFIPDSNDQAILGTGGETASFLKMFLAHSREPTFNTLLICPGPKKPTIGGVSIPSVVDHAHSEIAVVHESPRVLSSFVPNQDPVLAGSEPLGQRPVSPSSSRSTLLRACPLMPLTPVARSMFSDCTWTESFDSKHSEWNGRCGPVVRRWCVG